MGKPKSVCIVGAGPSGLVAAKTLLHTYGESFKVTILEKQKTIGGLWPTEPAQRDGLLNPQMPTNLSKYTVSFSDLGWASVDLGVHSRQSFNSDGSYPDAAKQSGGVPMFPKAWQVGRYLQTYVQRYLGRATICLESTVTSAVREQFEGGYRWRVNWIRPCGHLEKGIKAQSPDNRSAPQYSTSHHCQSVYDFLIVASGFFGMPKIPPLPGLASFSGTILHSTELRKLNGLITTRSTSEKTKEATIAAAREEARGAPKIVVVGGGMSGAEAAASLALQISTARHSPQPPSYESTDYQIYHVTSRPFYALPTYAPIDPVIAKQTASEEINQNIFNHLPSFAPLDLCMYNLTRRRPGPISDYSGPINATQARTTHSYLSALVGGHQHDLGSDALHIKDDYQNQPARVVISDSYPEFVRSGTILPVLRTTKSVGVDASGVGSVTIEVQDDERILEDVTAVVMATGFTPQHSLQWLPKGVLEMLLYDSTLDRIPIVLQHHSYRHSEIPDLGFVGFYEGPYWGVMEMQARMLAREWVGTDQGDSSRGLQENEYERERILAMRTALRDQPGSFNQFWMGDYVGLMESLARALGIERAELKGFEKRGGPLSPSRYSYANDAVQVTESLTELDNTMRKASEEAAFVAKAAFRAMQGTWKLQRILKSALPTYPSGKFTGVASFYPRLPTDEQYDAEYLYLEEGELVTESGMTMRGSRCYVYRYREKIDTITAWFVKPEDNKSVDYLFHELRVESADAQVLAANGAREGWVAKGHHLCVDDDYESQYLFRFRGAAIERFMIRYNVKGPKKDYIAETWYER